jgi:hypothetical protein
MAGEPLTTSLEPVHYRAARKETDMYAHPLTRELAAARRDALAERAAHARLARAARRATVRPRPARGRRWFRPLTAQPVHA